MVRTLIAREMYIPHPNRTVKTTGVQPDDATHSISVPPLLAYNEWFSDDVDYLFVQIIRVEQEYFLGECCCLTRVGERFVILPQRHRRGHQPYQ